MHLQDLIIDLSFLCALLLAGSVLCIRIRLLRKLFIPASIVSGLLGLALIPSGLIPISLSPLSAQIPLAGIDLIFAGLFIGRRIPPLRSLARNAGAQAAYAYINAFGQIAIGFLTVAALNSFHFPIHPLFALALVLGFQGGLGVSASVSPTVEKLGWSAVEMTATGECCALAGFFLAILFGLVLVNIGVRKGATVSADVTPEPPEGTPQQPLEGKGDDGGGSTFPGRVAGTISIHFGFIGLAVLLGYVLDSLLLYALPSFSFLPRFPFALIGGLTLQIFLQKSGLHKFIDRNAVERITAFVLDMIIISSLITVKISVVMMYAIPLLLLITAGFVFNVFMLVFLAPKILSGAWFEKAVCEYGQNTGSTPQALLLLRMIDPELKTGAAEAFALKMFLFSPVMFPVVMISMRPALAAGPLLTGLASAGISLFAVIACRVLCWKNDSGSVPFTGH